MLNYLAFMGGLMAQEASTQDFVNRLRFLCQLAFQNSSNRDALHRQVAAEVHNVFNNTPVFMHEQIGTNLLSAMAQYPLPVAQLRLVGPHETAMRYPVIAPVIYAVADILLPGWNRAPGIISNPLGGVFPTERLTDVFSPPLLQQDPEVYATQPDFLSLTPDDQTASPQRSTSVEQCASPRQQCLPLWRSSPCQAEGSRQTISPPPPEAIEGRSTASDFDSMVDSFKKQSFEPGSSHAEPGLASASLRTISHDAIEGADSWMTPFYMKLRNSKSPEEKLAIKQAMIDDRLQKGNELDAQIEKNIVRADQKHQIGELKSDFESRRSKLQEEVLDLTDKRNQFLAGAINIKKQPGTNVADLRSVVDPITAIVRDSTGDEILEMLDSVLETAAKEEAEKGAATNMSDAAKTAEAIGHRQQHAPAREVNDSVGWKTEDNMEVGANADRGAYSFSSDGRPQSSKEKNKIAAIEVSLHVRHLQEYRLFRKWRQFHTYWTSLDVEHRDHPEISLEIAWNLFTQGYVTKALDVTQTSCLRWRDSWPDRATRDALILMQTYFTFLCKNQLNNALNEAMSVQNIHDDVSPKEKFSEVEMAVQYFYYQILSTAIWEGLLEAKVFKPLVVSRLRAVSQLLGRAGQVQEATMFAFLLVDEMESAEEKQEVLAPYFNNPRLSIIGKADVCLKLGFIRAQAGDMSSSRRLLQEAEEGYWDLGCVEGVLTVRLRRLEMACPKTNKEIGHMQDLADDFEGLDSLAMQVSSLWSAGLAALELWSRDDFFDILGRIQRVLSRTGNRYDLLKASLEFSLVATQWSECIGKTIEMLQNSVESPSEETPRTTGQSVMNLAQAYITLGDRENSLKYAKLAFKMMKKKGMDDLLSDATLVLANAMTSGPVGPDYDAAINMLETSLYLDRKQNYMDRMLKKYAAIATLEGRLDVRDTNGHHMERRDQWMAEWELTNARVSHDDVIQKAQLYIARKEFNKAEELLREAQTNQSDGKDLRWIAQCQHMNFLCCFLPLEQSNDSDKMQEKKIAAILTRARAAFTAYRKIGLETIPIEFINDISRALEVLGQHHPERRSRLYSEALEYLDVGASIFENMRINLSASSGWESLHQKQILVASSSHREMFNRALRLAFAIGDTERVWGWTQKAKARALSDMVASKLIVPNLPPREPMDDEQTAALAEEEATLARELESANHFDSISIRAQLDLLRAEMDGHSTLRHSLAMKTSKIDLQDLQWIFNNSSLERLPKNSKIVLVDWVVIDDAIVMLTLDASLAPQISLLDITLSQVRVWKQLNLLSHTSRMREKKLTEGQLDKLNGLVSELARFTLAGDLLVLCPSRTLHAIPLHALKIAGKPLIIRNSMVYTTSLSLLRLCCERANARMHKKVDKLRISFFSVYEDDTKVDEERDERERTYTCMTKLASDFGSTPTLGIKANRENLLQVGSNSDILHYHGHMAPHPNVLYQSLVLSGGEPPKSSHPSTTSRATPSYRPRFQAHEEALTVRDVFSLRLNLSVASIIACSSGVQDFTAGDEPQGLLAALQYAGCATTIGTLWPVDSEDGRDFAVIFFRLLKRQQDNVPFPWNLALSFQEAIKQLMRRSGTSTERLRLDQPYYWAGFVMHGAWYV